MAELVAPLSPALVSRLKRLDTNAASAVEAAFAFAGLHGAAVEDGLTRTKGASFNPRPSRIAQILWDEAEVRDSAVLCAAALSCMSAWDDDAAAFPGAAIAREVKELLARALPRAHRFSSPNAADLFLAQRVDELRHVHMLSEACTRDAMERLAAEKDLWSTLVSHRRLVELAHAAFARLRRDTAA
jgi:hypothetical protein